MTGGWQKCYLKDYGYDFVVATTQNGLNATMYEYLKHHKQPEMRVIWTANSSGKPVPVDYDKFVKRSGVTDLFTIPSWETPDTPEDEPVPQPEERLRKLYNNNFLGGVYARLGRPAMSTSKLSQLPDILKLGPELDKVQYNLLCAELVVVELNPPGGYNKKFQWIRQSQEKDHPIVFTSSVNIGADTTSTFDWDKLSDAQKLKYPKAVQDQAAALRRNHSGTAFSIQQLFLDLDTATSMSVPTLDDTLSPDIKTLFNKWFVTNYFERMKLEGKPVLAVAIPQHTEQTSSLAINDLVKRNMAFLGDDGSPVFNPAPEQRDVATLNYLCMTGSNKLPGGDRRFNWNWVDPSEVDDHHGVIAISQEAFSNFLHPGLLDYVKKLCLRPEVKNWRDFPHVFYEWQWHQDGEPTCGTMSVNPHAFGGFPGFFGNVGRTANTVRTYSYESMHEADAGMGAGAFKLENHVDVTMSFCNDNSIQIDQHWRIFMYIRNETTKNWGNLINRKTVTQYDLKVDGFGNLILQRNDDKTKSTEDDLMDDINAVANFFSGVNDLKRQVQQKVTAMADNVLGGVDLKNLTKFVFPGGREFSFDRAGFTEARDLVAMIKYVT